MTPELEDRLCYTATESGSYERAAKLAAKWGSPVEDSTVQKHVQKVGALAQEQTQERTTKILEPATRSAALLGTEALRQKKSFSLVIMMDSHLARERGPDWGLKPSQAQGKRVEWHEVKSAVIYRFEPGQEPAEQSKRPVLLDKHVVARRAEWLRPKTCLSSPMEGCGFGRSKRIGSSRPSGCWTFTTPASICGPWLINYIPKRVQERANGSSRC